MKNRLVAGMAILSVLAGACATPTTGPAVTAASVTTAAPVATGVTTAPAALATVPGGPVGLFASELVGYDLRSDMDSVPISRSLVVDGTLFTLSWLGLKGSDLETLSDTSWIPFPFLDG